MGDKYDNVTLDVYAFNYTVNNGEPVSTVGELTVNVSSYLWLVITSYTFFMMSLYLFFVVLCIKLYNYTPKDVVNVVASDWKNDVLVCDWGTERDSEVQNKPKVKCDKNRQYKNNNNNNLKDVKVKKKSNSCGPKIQSFKERCVKCHCFCPFILPPSPQQN